MSETFILKNPATTQQRSPMEPTMKEHMKNSICRVAYSTVTWMILGLLVGGIVLACVLALYISNPSVTKTIARTTSISTTASMTTDTTTTTTIRTSTTTPSPLDRWNSFGTMLNSHISFTSTYIPETDTVLLAGGIGVATIESAHPSNLSFVDRGNLTQVRSYHTADRLDSGVVLLAGGGTDATAEIYDPLVGRVVSTLRMNIARTWHTSSIIEIGGSKKVVFIGGQTPLTATGEVYDTATGIFTPVRNNMTEARYSHTATTLPNGNVLITGGCGSSLELDTLELYNSTSNVFMPLTAKLSRPRQRHTATYIPSMQAVLITGGYSPSYGFIESYDLFDVNTLTFRQLNGSMLKKRARHTATLLMDGRVLLTGGNDGTGYSNTCEIYDPTTNSFTMTTNMTSSRRWHSATLLTSTWQVLVCGGHGTSSSNTCEIYTP